MAVGAERVRGRRGTRQHTPAFKTANPWHCFLPGARKGRHPLQHLRAHGHRHLVVRKHDRSVPSRREHSQQSRTDATPGPSAVAGRGGIVARTFDPKTAVGHWNGRTFANDGCRPLSPPVRVAAMPPAQNLACARFTAAPMASESNEAQSYGRAAMPADGERRRCRLVHGREYTEVRPQPRQDIDLHRCIVFASFGPLYNL